MLTFFHFTKFRIPEKLSSLIELCWHANAKKRPSFDKIQERLLEIRSEIVILSPRKGLEFSKSCSRLVEPRIKSDNLQRSPREWDQANFSRQNRADSSPRSQFLGKTQSIARRDRSVNIGLRSKDEDKKLSVSPVVPHRSLLLNPPDEPAPPPPVSTTLDTESSINTSQPSQTIPNNQ